MGVTLIEKEGNTTYKMIIVQYCFLRANSDVSAKFH